MGDNDDDNCDWYYTGSSSTDNTRWQSSKTIYDPCPAGWRVPDGGENGVWSKALGSSSDFYYTYDSINEGMNFSGKFSDSSTIWYPASGYMESRDGDMISVGLYAEYWSVSPDSFQAYRLDFGQNGSVYPSCSYFRACGYSVRCIKVIEANYADDI